MANFDEQNSQMRVISECYVKNKYEIEGAKKTHFLGPVDLRFLHLYQMQRGLLFATKPKNMQSFLGNLKKSLSISLVDFYPLGGQLATQIFPDEEASWVYVDCNKGPGARFIHAIDERVKVTDILSSVDIPKVARTFFDLGIEGVVNYEGHHNPLLSIQVTELLDGVFIGFTMNHSLGDGTSLWHYISTLSEIYAQLIQKQCNNGDDENDNKIVISRKPMFKPYFPNGWGPVLKLPYLDVEKSITGHNNQDVLREQIFHFSSKSISKLKAKVNEECGVHNISSFQALSGFMWRSITRARKLHPGDETCCALVMDSRPRFSPPFSSDYFGNFVVKQQSMCKVSEVLDKGFGWAALLVHQVVVEQDDKAVRESYEKLVKFLCDKTQIDAGMGSPNMVLIVGSTRFDLYGHEFGLGKAETALAGNCSKEEGKITASPGREGNGSVDLEVCLKTKTMNALELDEEFMYFISPRC